MRTNELRLLLPSLFGRFAPAPAASVDWNLRVPPRSRSYAPELARWTGGDPAGMVDGTNMYAYVGGNPVSYADPNGTLRWFWQLGFNTGGAYVSQSYFSGSISNCPSSPSARNVAGAMKTGFDKGCRNTSKWIDSGAGHYFKSKMYRACFTSVHVCTWVPLPLEALSVPGFYGVLYNAQLLIDEKAVSSPATYRTHSTQGGMSWLYWHEQTHQAGWFETDGNIWYKKSPPCDLYAPLGTCDNGAGWTGQPWE